MTKTVCNLQRVYMVVYKQAGMAVPEILKMSAKASSIAVTREGAAPSIPYRDEVMKALAEN